MGQITVRQLDESLIQALRPGSTEFWARMERRRASHNDRILSDSADLVRRMRDERSESLVDR